MDARPGAAGLVRCRPGPRADGAPPVCLGQNLTGPIVTRLPRCAGRGRASSETSPTRSPPTSRSVDSELSAMLFRELLGFSAPDPGAVVAAARGTGRRPDAGAAAAAVDRRRMPLFGLAGTDSARSRADALGGPLSMHLGESRRRWSSSRRHRRVAGAAREARRVDAGVGAAGRAVRSSYSIGWAWSTTGCSPSTACSSPTRSWRGSRRRSDGRDVPAEQPLDGRRRPPVARSTRRACASPSARTAWPASRI